MAPGDILGGKYRLLRKLGSGGMGVVYEAQHLKTEAFVAVKLLRPDRALDPKLTERLLREARAAARLKSQFVVRVFDLDTSDEAQPVLVMELLNGLDLGAELRRAGRLEVADAVSYLVQACAAVWEAHASGIIHRDLKPANLFIEESIGVSPRVRVLDFGLAKSLLGKALAPLTAPRTAIGTIAYMAPEQLRGDPVIDARSDVWSLGVVLYRMLRGRLPFDEQGAAYAERVLGPEEMPRLGSDLAPEGLVAVVARALSKSRERRFDDARELARELVPFLEHPSAMTVVALEELDVKRAPGDDPTTIPNVTDEPLTVPNDTREVALTLPERRAPAETLPETRSVEVIAPPAETLAELPPLPVTARTRRRERPTTSHAVPIVGALFFVVLILAWLAWDR